MANVQTCDYCGKPAKIVVKIFKVSLNSKPPGLHGNQSQMHRDRYTAHADIGECCVLKVNQINWRARRRKGDKSARASA